MKKITYNALTLIAIFINSNAYAVEAKVPTTSFNKALENVKNKTNFASLKNAKFNVKKKVYEITYLNKEGSVDTIKISKLTGKEVK